MSIPAINTHGGKKWPFCPVFTTAARKVAEIKTCLGVQMVLNTLCSGLCNCRSCSVLCQGVPCLAVFIRRLYIKALMLSICFEHIVGVNQLNASLPAPTRLGESSFGTGTSILLWSISRDAKQLRKEASRWLKSASVLPPAHNSPVAVGRWIYTSHLWFTPQQRGC